MIVVYTSPGCASCRKVKAWLNQKQINYIEKNIFQVILDPKEIKYLLSRSENGFDDIISKRSKLFQQGKVDLDHMNTNELVDFIQKNPSVLKRPIIINEENMQIGYDEEEIDAFVPRQLRSMAKSACNANDCERFATCKAKDEVCQ